MDLFIMIVLFILGAAVGMFIAALVLEKNARDLMEAYQFSIKARDDLLRIDEKIISAGSDIIKAQRIIIQETYSYLVDLRDKDEGSLDEIVGYLGQALDDHTTMELDFDEEDEAECNSNQ